MLYLVATPIGNLGDITSRAVKALSEADFIAAEDTRVTRKLLEHLGIKKQLVSYYEHNKAGSGERIVKRLAEGESCALVTDAGSPGVSDPGEELVRSCVEAGIPVVAIPGACAAVAALTLSGLASGRFAFEGFLSTARKNRFERLSGLKTEKRTMVFYEAPHKLLRTLRDMLEVFGDRRVSVSRELTKLHEETLRCTLREAVLHFERTAPRGEFTLVIEGAREGPGPGADLASAAETAMAYAESGASIKDAVKKASEEAGVPKNLLYNAVVKSNEEKNGR